jgi:hypothetical protein
VSRNNISIVTITVIDDILNTNINNVILMVFV